uniref:Annexin 13 n=1 Tax=Spironucleus barkhanus TaxID=103874 RepID=A0A142C665_SPIBA|nr:annexin 13 [Spironucleus barkhanus]
MQLISKQRILKLQNIQIKNFIQFHKNNHLIRLRMIIFRIKLITYNNFINKPDLPLSQKMPNFKEQAEKLYKAMKGLGTNEQVIFEVASSHTAEERFSIAEAFVGLYGDTLEKWFKKELSGNLEKLMVPLFKGRYAMWAQFINDAVKGAGTDERSLIELVFLMNDADQQRVEIEYQRLFGKQLKQSIENDISGGHWAKLIRAWLHAKNDSGADPEKIADDLWNAAKGAGTDEQVFMQILANCHADLYRKVCDVFLMKYRKDLAEIIKREFSGKSEDAFMSAHYSLYDKRVAVARQLKLAYKGAGTDEMQLIRATVLFSDRVRGHELKEAYQIFGDVLKDTKRDLTGKFEKAVIQMWQM